MLILKKQKWVTENEQITSLGNGGILRNKCADSTETTKYSALRLL